MDGKRRQIVEDYRGLLMKNVILSDDFFRTLVTHSVFPQHVVDDIKKAPRGSGQAQLVDMLLTRGNDGFGKFCDVLEVTGHHFLSDCLREAENYEKPEDIDFEEMFNHFPGLRKALKDDAHKVKLVKYFKDKVAKEVLKQTWRGDIKVKEQLMIARQKQIEQVWHFEEEAKIKEKSIHEIQADYFNLQSHCDSLRREIKSLHNHLDDLDRKHKEELRTQIQFNMANDRHLTRLNGRAEEASDVLAVVQDKLRLTMSLMYNENERIHAYQNLLVNFDSYMSYCKELAEKVRHFKDERVYIASHINANVDNDRTSLKPSFQEFIVQKEEETNRFNEEMTALRAEMQLKDDNLNQLRWLQDKISEEHTSGDTAGYALIQRELGEAKVAVEGKDEKIKNMTSKIKDFEKKIKELETTISVLKEQLAVAAKQHHSHHQKHHHASAENNPRQGVQLDPIVRPRSPALNGSPAETSPKEDNVTPQPKEKIQKQSLFQTPERLHPRLPGSTYMYAPEPLAPLETIRGQHINTAAIAAATAQLEVDAELLISQVIAPGASRQPYKYAGQSGIGTKMANPMPTLQTGTSYSRRQLASRAVKARKGA